MTHPGVPQIRYHLAHVLAFARIIGKKWGGWGDLLQLIFLSGYKQLLVLLLQVPNYRFFNYRYNERESASVYAWISQKSASVYA